MAASMRPPTMAAATRVAQAADDERRWCQGRANERKKTDYANIHIISSLIYYIVLENYY